MAMGTTEHTYAARLTWAGDTGLGYRAYDRNHTAGPPGLDVELSADPAFRGDPARLNPEQLLVMAASSCQLLSFLALAARKRVSVTAYEDDPTGVMPMDSVPVRITRVVLRPRITVAAGTDHALVGQLVHQAHDECYIANSLTTEVAIELTIVEGPLDEDS
jgi:organic hydroperoxide reductase OsmC/OhrA